MNESLMLIGVIVGICSGPITGLIVWGGMRADISNLKDNIKSFGERMVALEAHIIEIYKAR